MRDPRSNDFNGCKPLEYLCYFVTCIYAYFLEIMLS